MELIEHKIPTPGPGEVLIKTKSTSICGTDLHIWLWDDWSRDNVPLGTVTGHETCGEIVEVGEGVSNQKIGDLVAIECHFACWECPRCDEGNAHVCENGEIFGVHSNGAFAPFSYALKSTQGKSQMVFLHHMLQFKIHLVMLYTH